MYKKYKIMDDEYNSAVKLVCGRFHLIAMCGRKNVDWIELLVNCPKTLDFLIIINKSVKINLLIFIPYIRLSRCVKINLPPLKLLSPITIGTRHGHETFIGTRHNTFCRDMARIREP